MLDSIPIYVMSLFPIPASVVSKLDNLKIIFLWKGNKERGRYNLVEWEVKKRKMRIRNKEYENKKFGLNNPCCSDEVNFTYGMSVLRAIGVLWLKLQENSKFKVGNGNNVSFWKDNWIGEIPLQDKLLDLMLLPSNREIVVFVCWSPRVGI